MSIDKGTPPAAFLRRKAIMESKNGETPPVHDETLTPMSYRDGVGRLSEPPADEPDPVYRTQVPPPQPPARPVTQEPVKYMTLTFDREDGMLLRLPYTDLSEAQTSISTLLPHRIELAFEKPTKIRLTLDDGVTHEVMYANATFDFRGLYGMTFMRIQGGRSRQTED